MEGWGWEDEEEKETGEHRDWRPMAGKEQEKGLNRGKQEFGGGVRRGESGRRRGEEKGIFNEVNMARKLQMGGGGIKVEVGTLHRIVVEEDAGGGPRSSL